MNRGRGKWRPEGKGLTTVCGEGGGVGVTRGRKGGTRGEGVTRGRGGRVDQGRVTIGRGKGSPEGKGGEQVRRVNR